MATDHNHGPEDRDLNGAADILRAFSRMLRRQAWVLALLLGGMVASEIAVRVLRPDMAGLVYARNVTGGHPIVLSDKFFRIPETGNTPVDPVILALGDSTTFGTGVGAEDSWPLQLATHAGVSATVANAGFPGGDLTLLTDGLGRFWAAPEAPEIVLLLITSNMISFTEFHKETETPGRWRRIDALRQYSAPPPDLRRRVVELVQSSAAWKALSVNLETLKYATGLLTHRTSPDAPLSPLLAYGWQQPDLPVESIPRMWDTFEAELAVLQQQTDALGACLVIGFLPPRFMLSDRISDNLKFVPKNRLAMDAGARIEDIARDLGVPFADTAGSLRQARAAQGLFDAPLYTPGDYTHLSAQGHRVVADAFAQYLNADTCR